MNNHLAGAGLIGGGGVASCLGTACVAAVATTAAGAMVITDGSIRGVSGAVGAGRIGSMLISRASNNSSNKPTAGNPVHGNSLDSPKKTYLYDLVDENGNHQKYGITSNPARRYTQSFMRDKVMNFLDEGTRREMYDLEHQMILRNPFGRLQLNSH